MIKHYFINRQRGEEGPFTLDELSTMRLLSDTKVWYEGLVDWKNITDVNELVAFVIQRPPPINNVPTVEIPKVNPKYDVTYDKDIEGTYAGILLGVFTLGVNYWVGSAKFSSEEAFNSTMMFLRIASLIIRIIIVFYVIEIAKRQNRNTTGWGWFAFFMPTISLIIIGLQKKLFRKDTIVKGLENINIVNSDNNDILNSDRENAEFDSAVRSGNIINNIFTIILIIVIALFIFIWLKSCV
jgi:hypothetical protein